MPPTSAGPVPDSAPSASRERGTCVNGFVWREARAGDIVCVTPKRRSITANENRLAELRRRPNGGAYGQDTCLTGYVWRGAFDGDHACVNPASRDAAAEDNREGPSRVAP